MGVLSESSKRRQIIFVVDASTALSGIFKHLLTDYIVPCIEFFNGGPVAESNALAQCLNYYGVITIKPLALFSVPSCNYFPLTSNPSDLLQNLHNICFEGNMIEHCCRASEGLAAALEFMELTKSIVIGSSDGTEIEKYCIFVSNLPPSPMPVMESVTYGNMSYMQLAEEMAKNNVSLSVITPRWLVPYADLFVKGALSPPFDNSILAHADHALHPGCMVLLRGLDVPSLKARKVKIEPDTLPPSSSSYVSQDSSLMASGLEEIKGEISGPPSISQPPSIPSLPPPSIPPPSIPPDSVVNPLSVPPISTLDAPTTTALPPAIRKTSSVSSLYDVQSSSYPGLKSLSPNGVSPSNPASVPATITSHPDLDKPVGISSSLSSSPQTSAVPLTSVSPQRPSISSSSSFLSVNAGNPSYKSVSSGTTGFTDTTAPIGSSTNPIQIISSPGVENKPFTMSSAPSATGTNQSTLYTQSSSSTTASSLTTLLSSSSSPSVPISFNSDVPPVGGVGGGASDSNVTTSSSSVPTAAALTAQQIVMEAARQAAKGIPAQGTPGIPRPFAGVTTSLPSGGLPPSNPINTGGFTGFPSSTAGGFGGPMGGGGGGGGQGIMSSGGQGPMQSLNGGGVMGSGQGAMVGGGGPMASNQGPLASNQGPMTSNQGPMGSNQGSMGSNQGSMISNQGSMISNQGAMVSNHQGAMGQGGIGSNQGQMGPGQGQMGPTQGTMGTGPVGGMQQMGSQQQAMGGGQTNIGNQQGQPAIPQFVKIWTGFIEVAELRQQRMQPRQIQCHMLANKPMENKAELKPELWPQKILMSIHLKTVFNSINSIYRINQAALRVVQFQFMEPAQNVYYLRALQSNDPQNKKIAIVKVPITNPQCPIKAFFIIWNDKTRQFTGLIPLDQDTFVMALKQAMKMQQQQQINMAGGNPGMQMGGAGAGGGGGAYMPQQQGGGGGGGGGLQPTGGAMGPGGGGGYPQQNTSQQQMFGGQQSFNQAPPTSTMHQLPASTAPMSASMGFNSPQGGASSVQPPSASGGINHQSMNSMTAPPISSNSMMGGAGGGAPMSNQQQMLNALQNNEKFRIAYENANPEQKQAFLNKLDQKHFQIQQQQQQQQQYQQQQQFQQQQQQQSYQPGGGQYPPPTQNMYNMSSNQMPQSMGMQHVPPPQQMVRQGGVVPQSQYPAGSGTAPNDLFTL